MMRFQRIVFRVLPALILMWGGSIRVCSQTLECTEIDPNTVQMQFDIENVTFRPYFNPSDSNDSEYVIPVLKNGVFAPTNGGPFLPQIGFALIASSSAPPTITYSSREQTVLSEIKIPVYHDSLSKQIRGEEKQLSDPVLYNGIQYVRGIPLHSFSIKPFNYDKLLRRLTVFTKIVFQVSFSGTEPFRLRSKAAPSLQQIIKKQGLNGNFVQFSPVLYREENLGKTSQKWYNPSTPYLKILIAEDGIYHLTLDDLEAIGFPISAKNPQYLQMYFKGKPYPIFVSGEADSQFDSGDFIEFIGRRNTGTDEYYNSYSDTSVYWLTITDSPGLRFPTRSVAPADGTPVNQFYCVGHSEQDQIYYPGDSAEDKFSTDRMSGEGWVWSMLYPDSTYEFPFIAYNYAISEVPDSLFIKLRGITNQAANPDHRVSISINGVPVSDVSFDGYEEIIHRAMIPKGVLHLGANTLTLRLVSNPNVTVNAVNLDWFEIKYPRDLTASNNRLFFSLSEGKWKATIMNFHNDTLSLYDLDHQTRLIDFQVESYSDKYRLVFHDSVGANTHYVAWGTSQALSPPRLVLDTPSNWKQPGHQADYLIITHKSLMPQAERLAEYHRSVSGLQTAVVDVEDIYDEFSYGFFEPEAIRRFVSFAAKQWQTPSPQFLLLFGDASWDFKRNRISSIKTNLVPSYGNPVSDSRFACIDGENDFLPDLYVGRIPVETVQEAENVVDKIVQYATQPYEPWNKNIIFLNGGFNDWEQYIFKSHSEALISNYVEPPPFGGNSIRIYKESEGFVIGEHRGEIMSAINQGALWMSFQGHAGSETWDLMVNNNDLMELDNLNRLPFVSSMTCHTARFANPALTSFGELFIKLPRRGAIAFWGTSGWGYIFQDKILQDGLFRLALKDSIFTLGVITTLAKLHLWTQMGYSTINKATIDQYTLLGDPALQLHVPPFPDFAPSPEVQIFPRKPVESDSNISVSFVVNNFGWVPDDSVDIQIELVREENNQLVTSREITTAPLTYQNHFSTTINLMGASGAMRVQIKVDPHSKFQELSEENNQISYPFYVYSTRISISQPPPYSIIKTSRPILQVYAPEQAPEARLFQFELDSVVSMNSPFAQRGEVSSPNGIVARFIPALPLPKDSYFWRCRVRNNQGESPWVNGIFTIAEDEKQEGWLQNVVTGFEIPENTHLSMREDGVQLAISKEKFLHLEVNSAGYEDGSYCYLAVNYQVLNSQTRGHHVVAIDPADGHVVAGPRAFDTYADSSEANALADFLMSIPDSAVVLVGIRDEGSVNMTERAFLALEQFGSAFCRLVGFRDSWAMIGRRNLGKGKALEKWQPRGTGSAAVRDTLWIYRYPSALLHSGEIGPALRWRNMTWKARDLNSNSRISVTVQGWDRHLSRWLTIKTSSRPDTVDLTNIDAIRFPKLKLTAEFVSTDELSTPTFQNWTIRYDFPPDLASNSTFIKVEPATVVEGEPVQLSVPVYNVGMISADTSFLKVELLNDQSKWDSVAIGSVGPIPVDSLYQVSVFCPTQGKVGKRRFRITLDAFDQLNELSESNNQYFGEFTVLPDSTRPEIAILLGDRQLLSGDIVPLFPEFVIKVTDRSFLPFYDSSHVKLYLDGKYISFKNHPEDLELHPLSGDETYPGLEVRFRPKLDPGNHRLEIQATDASGNENQAAIDFLVEKNLVIRDVLNVPNPFRTETDFCYVLTQPATEVTLQIFTLSGLEIARFDGLPGFAGFNTFHWDGRDSDGDSIANGVYIYQIKARNGDQAAEATGKLALIR